jgi:hypothetical protein
MGSFCGSDNDDDDDVRAAKEAVLATTSYFQAVAASESFVLHKPTLTVGPAKAFYDGVLNRYVSPINGLPVPDPVLELENGTTLIAKQEAFVVLGSTTTRFFITLQDGLAGMIALAARTAVEQQIPQETAVDLVVAALRAQLLALGGGEQQ